MKATDCEHCNQHDERSKAIDKNCLEVKVLKEKVNDLEKANIRSEMQQEAMLEKLDAQGKVQWGIFILMVGGLVKVLFFSGGAS